VAGPADTVTLNAPVRLSAVTDPTVTVVTAAQIEAEGFPVTFARLVVVGWDGAVPAANADANLKVNGLPPVASLAGAEGVLQVTIGGLSAVGQQVTDDTVRVKIPASVAGPKVAVKISQNGRTSESVDLEFP